MLQLSLFPDGFEVQEQALLALEELDLDEAWRRVEAAHARDPGLTNLGMLRCAIAWLRRELGAGDASTELLAALFALVPEECRAERLDRPTSDFLDDVIARRGLVQAERSRAFVDGEERLHRGALLLVRKRAGEARALLEESLAAGLDERADLWGYHADACLLDERPDEANASTVRALMLGAAEVDLHRTKNERLAGLLARLRARHPEPAARELLFTHAWLEGLLSVPPENGWLDRHLSGVQLAAAPQVDASEAQRARRFGLLLYLDRSLPPGAWDGERREELQTLDPELFPRVLQRIQVLGGSRARLPARW